MALITNLPTDLLRTFISVVELGGHSKAGAVLGRSQPAISLQIRRLEELIRAPLLSQEGRAILPTPAGEALLSYAREMVRINDEAVRYFHRSDVNGVLRIGLPTDYAVAFLQGSLTGFLQSHPDVEMEIHCDLSRELHQQLRSDSLDIIVATMPVQRMPYLSRAVEQTPPGYLVEDLPVASGSGGSDLAQSRHGRNFVYVGSSSPPQLPGPISVWHLWLS